MSLIIKPYRLLLLVGFLFLFISFLPLTKTLDLHVYDSYFVIGNSFLFLTLACFFLVLWVVYKFAGRAINSQFLSWTHILLTISISLGIVIIYGNTDQLPTRYLEVTKWAALEPFESTNRAILFSVALLLLIQCVLIVNICKGYNLRNSERPGQR